MIAVKYTSAHVNPSGYGNAARNFITALWVAGVNVSVETVSQMSEKINYGLPGEVCKSLENKNIEFKVKIIHLTPDIYPMYTETGKYNIGHLFFECDKLPKEWIKPCNEMDEIWTASLQQAEMIKRSGVTTPIYSFPQPIDVNQATQKIEPFKLDYEKDFMFYSGFQWIVRKNPRGLLRAYWKEFQNNEKVTLILKVYRIMYVDGEYELIKKDIAQWKKEIGLSHFPKILLVHKLMTDQEIYRFHQMGDCFINPSSGEGWDRWVQEAMLLGKPVISGDNGGITDLMTPQYYYKSDSKEVYAKQQSFIPWYTSDMKWKEIDDKSVRQQMRSVFENQAQAKKIGKHAQEYVINNFSYQNVGASMKDRLEQIYKKI